MVGITYRLTKGSALSIEELDQNFLELDQRIAQVEKIHQPQEMVTLVKQEGDLLLFIGSQGNVLGKAQLPRLPFQPKGAWTAKAPYQTGDVVFHQKELLFCQKPHVKEMFDPQDWVVLLAL